MQIAWPSVRQPFPKEWGVRLHSGLVRLVAVPAYQPCRVMKCYWTHDKLEKVIPARPPGEMLLGTGRNRLIKHWWVCTPGSIRWVQSQAGGHLSLLAQDWWVSQDSGCSVLKPGMAQAHGDSLSSLNLLRTWVDAAAMPPINTHLLCPCSQAPAK